ncbi:peptidase/aminotransferase M23 family protein [Nitzschia inconspicua]|uniref:Peptidase/aminotransferase M23 family protein n=1 Tax=Nitzschia inconspicua TaxID=303405 RepID=A0A9K3LRR0_9STRA|nr:peptidase/aminotransferase M23 family protein [Nitzschia inconspicua]
MTVGDHRTSQGMATLQQIQQAKRMAVLRSIGRWTRCFAVKLVTIASSLGRIQLHRMLPPLNRYAIGKYDENRVGMYDSDLFDNLDNTIDGYGGRRTVHLGIDLSAPVGTPVHAFASGVVHSVGYNPDHGDYGYVIVIEHHLQLLSSSHNNNNNNNNNNQNTTTTRRVWALYGHLDKSTVQRKESSRPGLPIRKGQVIGRLGDIYENGGWLAPHVHFQLSTKPPDQPHDMPGASSVEDRPTALLQYPDPRYVLGPLY